MIHETCVRERKTKTLLRISFFFCFDVSIPKSITNKRKLVKRMDSLHYVLSEYNLGDKKNGGFLEVLLQGLSYSIWIFSVILMKVSQICYSTVKESFKSMDAVRSNSYINNTVVIYETPS